MELHLAKRISIKTYVYMFTDVRVPILKISFYFSFRRRNPSANKKKRAKLTITLATSRLANNKQKVRLIEENNHQEEQSCVNFNLSLVVHFSRLMSRLSLLPLERNKGLSFLCSYGWFSGKALSTEFYDSWVRCPLPLTWPKYVQTDLSLCSIKCLMFKSDLYSSCFKNEIKHWIIFQDWRNYTKYCHRRGIFTSYM